MQVYSVDETEDEFGQARFFVASPSADWVDGPYDTVEEASERCQWRNRKQEGSRVETLLSTKPVGFEFRLEGAVQRAYAGTWRKNADGLWDQVSAPDRPLVRNMDAAHLGFVVGERLVREALLA
jgi:hypothetical protein